MSCAHALMFSSIFAFPGKGNVFQVQFLCHTQCLSTGYRPAYFIDCIQENINRIAYK